jgi:hypothetical protein
VLPAGAVGAAIRQSEHHHHRQLRQRHLRGALPAGCEGSG